MANADLVIHDAQYTPEEYGTKKNWGHSTFDYVTEVAVAAGVRKLALTHHDPTHDDDFVFDIERRARETAARRGSSIEIFCAYEGCSLDIETGEGSQPEIEQLTSAQPPVAQNLLLVDDNEELRKLTKRFLEREGFTIQEASNGRDALDRLAESIPNLLVLDLDMPQMGGLEVLRFVRAQPKIMNVPVLILTGSEEEASISACFAAGATDFILKPFSTPQLIARVRACLARVAAPHNAPGN
jgi:CheY-like chemotaxis protein